MLTRKRQADFAICVADEGYDDLEVWKVYRVLADPKAAEVGCIRVIDESGEDYLYPISKFIAVDFPKDVLARLPRWQPSHGSSRPLQAAAKTKRGIRQ